VNKGINQTLCQGKFGLVWISACPARTCVQMFLV